MYLSGYFNAILGEAAKGHHMAALRKARRAGYRIVRLKCEEL